MVDMARAAGLKRLKVEGLEFEFADEKPPAPAASPAAVTRKSGRRVPTALELLLWSTGEVLPSDLPNLSDADRQLMLRDLQGLPSEAPKG